MEKIKEALLGFVAMFLVAFITAILIWIAFLLFGIVHDSILDYKQCGRFLDCP